MLNIEYYVLVYSFFFIFCNESFSSALKSRRSRCVTRQESVNLQHDVTTLMEETKNLKALVSSLLPEDCSVAKSRGSWTFATTIKPPGLPAKYLACDQRSFEGGWTVVLKRDPIPESPHAFEDNKELVRQSGRLQFNRSWEEYKMGFGNPATEYWLGNEVIHSLTENGIWEAMVILEDWYGDVGIGRWNYFRVENEANHYKLNVRKYESRGSEIGDGLSYHNSRPFSTYDRENDEYEGTHCAQEYNSGWWFHKCHVSLLTGTALGRGEKGLHSMHWMPWKNVTSLKSARLMIRPYVL